MIFGEHRVFLSAHVRVQAGQVLSQRVLGGGQAVVSSRYVEVHTFSWRVLLIQRSKSGPTLVNTCSPTYLHV